MNIKMLGKWFSRFITVVMFAVLAVLIFVVVSSKLSGGEPQLFGYQLKTVLSGSMEPGIMTGSVIAVKPDGDMTRFKKNDVITYRVEDNKLVTHRVTKVVKNGDKVMYRTKGDNNRTEDMDPVLSENVVAEYAGYTIPYAGYIIDYAKSKNGSALLLILPGLLLLCYSFFTIWQAVSNLEKKQKASETIEKTV
ncbi:signal peptidase I SipW [Mesobacillus zeae]|uniref:Signal peptidase I n=1 Tax=Mesobacillus zeae TaxID=1917180 RepID=A0A398AXX3_9BACI|nr:signal peptidase I [Mesobacillus zeae]RID82467.1 signal peptidase I [Mesobacillus zeae]